MVEKTVVTHKDLEVWKKAMDLAAQVYSLTSRFPKEELHGLTSQIRQSAVSIPSNIAEDAARHSRKECTRFLHIPSGSVSELETQLLLAIRMGFISGDSIISHIEEVRKLLLGLLHSLKKKPLTHRSSLITTSS